MTATAVSYLETAIANYRVEVLAEDAKTLKAVIDLFTPVRARLMGRVAALEAQLAESGKLSIADALRLDRAQELLRQTEAELARLAPKVEAIIEASSRRAVVLAGEHAQGLTVVSALQGGQAAAARVNVAWTRLNTGAVEQILGRLSTGSPLRKLLDDIGPKAGKLIGQTLSQEIALGTNPRAIAKLIEHQAVNVPAARLLLISRTEALNAYRGASAAVYGENDDILDGMIWTSAKGSNTCLACLSQDGTVYPLGSSFQRFHPGCRCSLRPSLKGIDNHALPSGRDWFYAQPKTDQVRMVRLSTGSESAASEYAAGRFDLDDFVAVDRSAQWGDSHRVASTPQARRNASRRERRAA